MDDLISRQAAIDIVDGWFKRIGLNGDICLDGLRQLPSAQPKQRTGKWIHISEEMWKCDQCGEISCCSPKYCPDCGSRNEVTE